MGILARKAVSTIVLMGLFHEIGPELQELHVNLQLLRAIPSGKLT